MTEVALEEPVTAQDKLGDPGEASAEALGLARELGVSITLGDVLHRAGRGSDEATTRFLAPRLAHLTPPDAMADRDAATSRLARAVRANESIAVFGDYDCDGITATAVLTSIVRAVGGRVSPLIASRSAGGYGFSQPALQRVRETGASLLVTCDCGSSDHERIAAARAAGIDVIVIDHHLVPDEPLPALAFLNPHRPDCGFPYKGLASCGLALSVGAALRKELGVDLDVRTYLDLVAIGTVADVAPLDGDNRALVRAGLGVLAQGARPGLRALAELAKLGLSQGVTGEDISFRIAPRLNAPGRLGDPTMALDLLLATDPDEARRLAGAIEQVTQDRRAVQERMLAEAVAEVARSGFDRAPAILLAQVGWHPGVVGIVAGRVASEFGKPTIVAALDGSVGRGSVRGPKGFRLHDALTRCKDELVGFGGHQAAAGVDFRAERLAALRDRWSEACAEQGSASLGPVARGADVRLDDRDDPAAVVTDMAKLEPCGESNPSPLLLLRAAKVRSARDVKGHLKLELGFGSRVLPAFAFQLGGLAGELKGAHADVLGRLRWDAYRGGGAVEVRVERIERR
jgi:single-stranded-DNA-specific exonuclease